MCIHTHASSPKRFARPSLEGKKKTFCGKKEEKAVSQTEMSSIVDKSIK